jgi:hypothetical protein
VLVEKTGGAREREAFALLDARVADAAAGATAGGVTAVGHDRRA